MTASKVFKFVSNLILILLVIFLYDVYSSSKGYEIEKTEPSSKGCNCHGSPTKSTELQAKVDGGVIFEPGERKTINIFIKNENLLTAGLNAAIKTDKTEGLDVGDLKAGKGTKVRKYELVHSEPQKKEGDTFHFSFDWEAPKEAGEYYLLVAGLAANNDNSTSGDEFNWMKPVTLIVKGIYINSFRDNAKFKKGTKQNITWEDLGIDQVRIELSSDGGRDYDKILADSITGNSWEWDIPSNLSKDKKYKLKITDVKNPSTYSDRKFKIK